MLAKHARGRETLRYPAEIVRWLREQGDETASIGPVCQVLQKFVDRGWLTNREETPGSDMKFYTLTPLGERVFCTRSVEGQRQIGWMVRSIVEGLVGITGSE